MAELTSGVIVDAVSMASNITSSHITLGTGYRTVSLHAYAASDTHVGTLAAQVSNDATNWNSVTLSNGNTTVSAANGSAFNETLEITTASLYLRVLYTASSGAGTLTVTQAGEL
jgi:hypothetical protein